LTLRTAGVPFDAVVARPLNVTDAVTDEELPLYVAVTVCDPVELTPIFAPVTTRVAVAVPFDPTRVADPSPVVPAVNTTDPTGVKPLLLVAVAIRKVVSDDTIEFKLLSNVRLIVGGGGTTEPLQADPVVNEHTSTVPRPVTRS
jgi:hypothetical protein